MLDFSDKLRRSHQLAATRTEELLLMVRLIHHNHLMELAKSLHPYTFP